MERTNISSGAPLEDSVGYSRAVRVGNMVFVAGTAAYNGDAIVAIGDAYGQTQFILTKIEKALQQAGADITHVVRTRIYVTDIANWEAIAQAHGEVFKDIKPAATMVVVKALVDEKLLVEIEADAVIYYATGLRGLVNAP